MKTFFFFGLLAMVLSGCVRSESEFYADSDIVTNFTFRIPAVATEAQQVVIEPWIDQQGFYYVTYLEKHCAMRFRGVLFQIGTNRFFDLYPIRDTCDHLAGTISPMELMHELTLQPLHVVVKAPLNTNEAFATVDQQGLKAARKKAPEFFQPAGLGEIPKMVSDTGKLRDFLARFGGDREVFSKEFTRSDLSPTNRIETTKPNSPPLNQSLQPRRQFE